MAKTFAQWLIDDCLPSDMRISRQVDKSYLNELLSEVARKHPDRYDTVVMRLKRLGDKLSTLEAFTMGLDEISTPNKAKRDAIVKKYDALVRKEKDPDKIIPHLEALQTELARNDMSGGSDDATLMVGSSMQSNRYQLMKLRTSPGVVGDHSGKVVPEIFPKSYAEGVDPLHFWLGATESRKLIAQGQVMTSKPGELLKVYSNVLSSAVVSSDDCGTLRGILLNSKDDDLVDRYLARDTGRFKRNTLVTADIQQELLKSGIIRVLVRSPETCEGPNGSVCAMCMGIRPGTGKKYEIGDNAGLITAGSIGEPLTQITISSKHATTLAKKEEGLVGEKGLRQFVEVPENYPNRKVLCEIVGRVQRVRMAPQGGWLITIRETRKVPERYIVHGMKVPRMVGTYEYHVPPNLKVLESVKEGAEVWPGMELSTGVDNMKDVARLRNLGFARSTASQNLYDIYKNTGVKLDRRHFELFSRNMNPYVRIVSAPRGSDLLPGDTVTYQELTEKVSKLPSTMVPVKSATGKTLAAGVLNLTVGTEVDERVSEYLSSNGVQSVKVVDGLSVEAVSTPLTRVVNRQQDWIGALGHRYLKNQVIDAASTGKRSDIHGYNPVTAYAVGTELRKDEKGRY